MADIGAEQGAEPFDRGARRLEAAEGIGDQAAVDADHALAEAATAKLRIAAGRGQREGDGLGRTKRIQHGARVQRIGGKRAQDVVVTADPDGAVRLQAEEAGDLRPELAEAVTERAKLGEERGGRCQARR